MNKEELMAQILQMDSDKKADTATKDWLANIEPSAVQKFSVTYGSDLSVTVNGITRQYTDESVFVGFLSEILQFIDGNLLERQSQIEAKEAELKNLL